MEVMKEGGKEKKKGDEGDGWSPHRGKGRGKKRELPTAALGDCSTPFCPPNFLSLP